MIAIHTPCVHQNKGVKKIKDNQFQQKPNLPKGKMKVDKITQRMHCKYTFQRPFSNIIPNHTQFFLLPFSEHFLNPSTSWRGSGAFAIGNGSSLASIDDSS
jgi:hypothetical protein